MKTHIAIQYVGQHQSFFHAKNKQAFWTTFILASLGGLLFGTLLMSKSFYLHIDSPLEQLALVSGSKIPSHFGGTGISTSTPPSSDTHTKTTGEVAGAETIAVAPQSALRDEQAIADVNTLINTIELSIIRINNEMELVKNSSIALVAEFDRNCGNWKDDCGAPYAVSLEKNNTHYDELVTKRMQMESDRESALLKRTSLMSGN